MTGDDTAYTNPTAIKFEFVKKIKVLAKKIQSRTILIGSSSKYKLGVPRYRGYNEFISVFHNVGPEKRLDFFCDDILSQIFKIGFTNSVINSIILIFRPINMYFGM